MHQFVHKFTKLNMHRYCVILLYMLYIEYLCIFCSVYDRRGSFLSTTIFVYALSSPINGYFGGSLYSRMGGMYSVRHSV